MVNWRELRAEQELQRVMGKDHFVMPTDQYLVLVEAEGREDTWGTWVVQYYPYTPLSLRDRCDVSRGRITRLKLWNSVIFCCLMGMALTLHLWS